MLDDRKRAAFEQNAAEAGEIIPAMYRSLYTGFVTHGFRPEEAMALVQTYIVKDCAGGLHLPKVDPIPKKPEEEE